MDHQADNPRWGFLPDERTLVGNDRQAAFLDAVNKWAPDQAHLITSYLLPMLIPGIPNRNQGVRSVPGSMVKRAGRLARASVATTIHHRDMGLMRAECGYFVDHLVLGARDPEAIEEVLSESFGASRCLSRVAFQQWEYLTAALSDSPLDLALAREGFVRGLDRAAAALVDCTRGNRHIHGRYCAATGFIVLGSKLFGETVRSEVCDLQSAIVRAISDRPGALAVGRAVAVATSYAGSGEPYAKFVSDPVRARFDATIIAIFAQRGLTVPFSDDSLYTGSPTVLGKDRVARAEATLGYVRACLSRVAAYWTPPLRSMLLAWCKAACEIGKLSPGDAPLASLHKCFSQIGKHRLAEWMTECAEFDRFYSELHLAHEGRTGPPARPFELRWRWPGFAERLFHAPTVD